MISALASAIAWATWGAVCGLVCDRSNWNSGRLVSCSAVSALAAVGTPGRALSSPVSLAICFPMFLLCSRFRVIGLTGGIASGKSEASRFLRQLGVPVIDADIIAHQVMQRGKPAHRRVVAAFKDFPEIVTASGDIDRAALRELVFSDKNLNRKLKKCTHTAIASEMLMQIFWHSVLGREPVVVLDAPLLFESKADLLCKHTVVVHCSETTQISRLSKRDASSAEQCRKAIDAQMPTQLKLAKCDMPLDNDSTVQDLHSKIEDLVARLRLEARMHPLSFMHRRSDL
mmetsp:Transcript_79481/g.128754  ORF Transcript_79481/g.128754 Transcript_79481/m.128754 type:complete len:286 (+) Transcript_79481:148-1005(+)